MLRQIVFNRVTPLRPKDIRLLSLRFLCGTKIKHFFSRILSLLYALFVMEARNAKQKLAAP